MQLHTDASAEEPLQTAVAEDGVVRALSLANALLSRPGGLTREQLFDKVELYRSRRDERDRLTGDERRRADAALEKLFGHDKEHLRRCGIDLIEPTADDDYRYRISRQQYGLPDLELTHPERIALFRAQLLFAQDSAAGLQHAVWAIAPEHHTDAASHPPHTLRSSIGSEAEVSRLVEISTIGTRVAVMFRYTARGRRSAETRRVVPLGTGVRGHWYVIAHDLDRDAVRVFRLDRVSGPVATLPATSITDVEADTVQHIAQHRRYQDLDIAAELDRTVESRATEREVLAGALQVHHNEAPRTLPKLIRVSPGHRRDDAATKTERVINMVSLLLARDGVQPSELMSTYGIAADQLLRDLLSISMVTTGEFPDTLDVQPFPPLSDTEFTADYLAADEPIVLRSGGGALDRPVSLTKPGALSLMVALKALTEASGPGDQHIAEAAQSLQRKVMTIVPTAIADAAASMSLAQRASLRPVMEAAQQAISIKHALSITYTDVSGRHSSRVVEPVQIVYDGPHTYLRAWCRSAQGERFFRVDRITEFSSLQDEPQGEQSASLELTDGRGPEVPETKDSVNVVLRFSPSAAGQAVLYGPVKQHTQKDSGARTIATSFVTRQAVVRTCLQAGGDIEVVRPEALRREVADRARELLEPDQP